MTSLKPDSTIYYYMELSQRLRSMKSRSAQQEKQPDTQSNGSGHSRGRSMAVTSNVPPRTASLPCQSTGSVNAPLTGLVHRITATRKFTANATKQSTGGVPGSASSSASGGSNVSSSGWSGMGCSSSSITSSANPLKSKLKQQHGRSKSPINFLKIDHLKDYIPGAHQGGITTMTVSEDLSLLVTCGEDFKAKMWSTFSEPVEHLGTLEGHTGYITAVIVAGSYIYTGSADSTIRKWSCLECHCCWIYKGHESRINKILLAGHYLYSSSYDRTARVWYADLERIDVELGLDPNQPEAYLETSPDPKKSTSMVVPQPKDCHLTFTGHEKGVYPIMFLPDPNNDLNSRVICAADILITGSLDCTVRTWSLLSGECLKVLKHDQAVTCLALDPFCRNHIFTAGGDSKIRCWDLVTGDLIRELGGHENSILCLLPVNRMLYSGSSDRTARCWIMEFGDNTRTYFRSRGGVASLRYFDGILYTGSTDCSARAYDAKSGTLKRTFKGHSSAITCIEVVPGKLFSGSYDGNLLVWKTDGIKEDSVFGKGGTGVGTTTGPTGTTDDLEEDSENVRNALRKIEPHMKHFASMRGNLF